MTVKSSARAESLNSRRFGTTDLAIVMGLWSAMAVVLGGVLSELTGDTETPRARSQAEAYALQLQQNVDLQRQAQSERSMTVNADRAPASLGSPISDQEGQLGKDPWGQPYRYRVAANGVFVWSSGPNGESESDGEIDRLNSKQTASRNTVAFHFQGDDIGFVKAAHKDR